MTEVINLQGYRIKSREEKVFGPWKKRFGNSFDYFTRLTDLSESTLFYLAKPGRESVKALRELIMAVLNLGTWAKYFYLENADQSRVEEARVVLHAQVYLEIMRRLGWIDHYPCERYSLVALIESLGKQNIGCAGSMPLLSEKHPDYSEYMKLSPEQRKVFLEEKFPEAFEAFKAKMKMG